MLRTDENGNVFDDGIPSWVDTTPQALQNPDVTPAEIAAYRTARSVKGHGLPVADDRYSWLGPKDPQRPSYIMEPTLEEAQGGMQLPTGLMQNDDGSFYYADTGQNVPVVRRPGILPIANTPEGYKFATPKLLDLVGNVMGNVGGPLKVAAKGNEMVLGAGMVRKGMEQIPEILMRGKNAEIGEEALQQLSKPDHFYRAMTHDEYEATVGAGKGIKSNQKYSVRNEGTSFAEDLPTAESYTNFGRTDPRKTGKPTYLIEIKGPEGLVRTQDGYLKAAEEIPKDRITNVIKMEDKDGSIVGKQLFSDTKGAVAAQVAKQVEKGPFYSTLERAVGDAKINLATPEQWLGYLKNQPGVKAEELNTVLKDLPKEGMLSKGQLDEFVKANEVSLKEKVLGDLTELPNGYEVVKGNNGWNVKSPGGGFVASNFGSAEEAKKGAIEFLKVNNNPTPTKYHQYQLPGGENYKEMLLSLPVKIEDTAGLTMNDIAKRLGYGGWTSSLKPEQVAEVEKVFASQKMGPTEYYNRISHLEEERANLTKIRDPKTNKIKEEEKWHRLSKEQEDLERAYKQSQQNSGFQAPHFDEHGTNLLAHVRMNDRNIEGNKSLHLEEVQSDWMQQGRKQGFVGEKEKLQPEFDKIEEKLMATNDEKMLGLPKVEDVLKEAVDKKIITKNEADTYKRYTDIENGKPVPDAPFKKNWDELVLKRMLHKAASEGYDALSWTPGEAQAARYDLSKQVEKIHWDPQHESVGKDSIVRIYPKNADPINLQYNNEGNVVASFPRSATNQFEGKNLTDVVGKEIAEKILNKKKGSLEGLDLKIGGEGMRSFYDKMLVDKANAIAKKYGSKVEQREIYHGDKGSYKYTGPEKTIEELSELRKHKGLTASEMSNVYDIIKNMQNERKSFSEAMSKFSSKGLAEKFGGELKPIVETQPIHYLPITPELRAKAKSGFPLFSSVPTTIPVDYQPQFEDKKSKYKLVPIEGNPFQ